MVTKLHGRIGGFVPQTLEKLSHYYVLEIHSFRILGNDAFRPAGLRLWAAIVPVHVIQEL